MLYADIIIDITHEAVDKTFQYKVGEPFVSLIKEGSLVRVPFGKGDTIKKGYCVGLSQSPKIDPQRLKEIASVEDSDISIEGQLVSLAMWMAKTYGSTKAAALRTVLPVSKRAGVRTVKTVSLGVEKQEAEAALAELTSKKRYSIPRKRLLEALINEGEISWEVITKKLNISSAHIRELEKSGLARIISYGAGTTPSGNPRVQKSVLLNDEQKACVERFTEDYDRGERKNYLLFGITGSGKTEVYIRMIDHCLKMGKSAIVLIPEIALTYQTLMRFYHNFGDQVSVINSRLTPGERYEIARKARAGEVRIIIGPRSALFTPFLNLGLIIIDEEHETSYKSEKSPRYHARETAEERARLSGASLVLGSATPSMESFYRVSIGEYELLKITKRAKDAKLAQCEVVDLRRELMEGNRTIISRRLREIINQTLENGKQAMLFINRRGMLASISCRACGEVIKCPHCDVSLSLHRDKKLHCHYCGYTIPAPDTCPKCGSRYIGGFKAGTEKIEKQVAEMFPRARVIRMDADSTKGKEGHEKILSVFANKGADILIGTQMIVKGHDFPDVSLVGILAADMSLNDNDFRSAERTFDLITQAAGRAGRGETAGHVIIQTYRPDHYAVKLSALQDYESFYREEISYRRLMHYPPCSNILLIMLQSKDEKLLEEWGDTAHKYIKNISPEIWTSEVTKPGISKLLDIHRRIIYLKDNDHRKLFKIRDGVDALLENQDKVSVYFDFNP